MAVWLSGSDVGQINEVALHRDRLVLGWVTVSVYKLPVREIYLGLTINQLPRLTHPGHPSVGRRNEYRTKDGYALQLGVKAGMARVWWQIKPYEPLYNMCHT